MNINHSNKQEAENYSLLRQYITLHAQSDSGRRVTQLVRVSLVCIGLTLYLTIKCTLCVFSWDLVKQDFRPGKHRLRLRFFSVINNAPRQDKQKYAIKKTAIYILVPPIVFNNLWRGGEQGKFKVRTAQCHIKCKEVITDEHWLQRRPFNYTLPLM